MTFLTSPSWKVTFGEFEGAIDSPFTSIAPYDPSPPPRRPRGGKRIRPAEPDSTSGSPCLTRPPYACRISS